MKYTALFLFSLLLMACSSSENEKACEDVVYESDFEIQIEEEVCFPDGTSLKLEDVRDEFCPCEAVCVWEGQLEADLVVTYPDASTETFILGSSGGAPLFKLEDNYQVRMTSFTHNGIPYIDCDNPVEFSSDKIVLRLMTESI